MSSAAQIRKWLTDNPGWHFAGDVCDAFGLSGSERTRLSRHLWRMGETGSVEMEGKRGSMKYRLGRPTRVYTVLQPR